MSVWTAVPADDFWHRLFSFQNYGELLGLVHNSLIAGAVLGLVGGLVGVFVMNRDMAFAVHGVSEISFAGGAAALLASVSVSLGAIIGSLVAAVLIGMLGSRARERNSITGVLMPFALGLGVLFLALYTGRSANKFGLLTGQIVAVDNPQLAWLVGTSVVVVVGMAVIWRPLMFASVDPDVAAARGVPARSLSLVFMVLLALAVAMAVSLKRLRKSACPAFPSRVRRAGSLRSRMRESARADASPGGTRRPETPCSTTSGIPPTRQPTTGLARRMAST